MKYKAIRIKFRRSLELTPELMFFKNGKTIKEALHAASFHIQNWELPTPEQIELMDGFGTVYETIGVWEDTRGELHAERD